MRRMIDFLKNLLAAPEPERRGPETPVAVAALLVEAARADGDYEPGEREAIDHILAHMFSLTDAAAAGVRAEGEAAQADAADLVRFTRVVKTEMTPQQRVGLMESLWRVVLTDGARDAHEDALLRKLAPLIAVTDRESAEARQRAAAG